MAAVVLFLILIRSPRSCVGWHWFKYGGDIDTASKGIVDRTYEPHAEFLDIMQELNERAYALADHFLNRAK